MKLGGTFLCMLLVIAIIPNMQYVSNASILPNALAQAHAATNANLFVSAENPQYDNYFAGPQVIQVIVADPDINRLDHVYEEPVVTINGKKLRMAQAMDGNWYAYFADMDQAIAAENTVAVAGKGLNFGGFCGPNSAQPKSGVDYSQTSGFTIARGGFGSIIHNPTFVLTNDMVKNAHCTTGTPATVDKMEHVIRENKTLNQNTGGFAAGDTYAQIWPVIQLYNFKPSTTVTVDYNKAGGDQIVNLTFDSIPDNLISTHFDKTDYSNGADVLITMNDPQLNIDPTEEDSWTWGASPTNNTLYYQAFDRNGIPDADGTQSAMQNLIGNLPTFMFHNNGKLTIDPSASGSRVIDFASNGKQQLNVPYGDPTTVSTINGHLLGDEPITFVEHGGVNTGVFVNWDGANKSNIRTIRDQSITALSADVKYNEVSQKIAGGWGYVDTLTLLPELANLTKVNQVTPPPKENESVPVIIIYKNSLVVESGKKELANLPNIQIKKTLDIIPAISAMVPAEELNEITGKYALAIIRNVSYHAASMRTDTNIRADSVWPSLDGHGVKIAILDTGLDLSHQEFQTKLPSGDNCHSTSSQSTNELVCDDWDSTFTHGTHVAGIAVATGNWQLNMKGVAPGSSLMIVQVLDWNRYALDNSDIINGISWAVIHGAKVISMSLSADMTYTGSACDDALSAGGDINAADMTGAIRRAISQHVTIIASTGNDGKVGSPACIRGVIAVGAVNYFGQPYNDALGSTGVGDAMMDHGLVAPGVGVNSTSYFPTAHPTRLGWEVLTGTSMAAPAVAGTVALMLQKNSHLKPNDIMQYLFANTCNNSPSCPTGLVPNPTYGYGILDASAAVAAVPLYRDPTTTTVTFPSPIDAGHSTAVHVSVVHSGGTIPLTGTVTFSGSDGGNFSHLICLLNSGGACDSIYTPVQSHGTVTITAQYSGDPNYQPSTPSSPSLLTINPISSHTTQTVVTPSTTSVTAGDPTTFHVLVSDTGGSPTIPHGTVTFVASSVGGHFSDPSCPLTSGACDSTYTSSPSSTSPVIITASYLPTDSHSASSGHATLTIIHPPPSPTDIAIDPSPSFSVKKGTTKNFIATLSSSNPFTSPQSVHFSVISGGGFFDPDTPVCNISSGDLQCNSTYNAPSTSGNVTISAQYLGDVSHNPKTVHEDFQVTDCMIATAAFGSPLAPQVQFLRDFRDNHLLQTSVGASFMNVFNSWYYSFSPSVANYEDNQPWFQQIIRTSIYPLLGILLISEKIFSLSDGNYATMISGITAVSLIGAVYVSPIAISVKKVRNTKFNYKIAAYLFSGLIISAICSILIENYYAIITTSLLFLLTLITVSAILSAKLIHRAAVEMKNTIKKIKTKSIL